MILLIKNSQFFTDGNQGFYVSDSMSLLLKWQQVTKQNSVYLIKSDYC